MPADAAAGGTIELGADLTVNRMGFGAMRLTGAGVWGEPRNPAEARRTLQRVRELGINFIDTADSYGPHVSEELIADVLHPYGRIVIATKGGLTRHGPDIWVPCGRPEYLRQCVLLSLRRLRLKRIDLWQLHRIDPKVPRDEQLAVIAAMRKEGLIRHVGLSNCSVEDVEAAQKVFPVASVQNRYNLTDRSSEAVLEHCEKQRIAFIPWYPLSAGVLTVKESVVQVLAERLRATPAQVALAWLLKRSPVMLPIPGTSRVQHLEENVRAASLRLSDEDFQALDREGRAVWERVTAARR